MKKSTLVSRSGGGLPNVLAEATIHGSISNETWRQAEALARAFLGRVMATSGFSHRFEPCIAALKHHIETAGAKIERLE